MITDRTHEILNKVAEMGLDNPSLLIENQDLIFQMLTETYEGKVAIKDVRAVTDDSMGKLIEEIGNDPIVRDVLNNEPAGMYVHYTEDVELPVQSCMIVHRDRVQRLHNFIRVDEGVNATFLTGCTVSPGTLGGEHRSITEIVVGDNAYLNYTMIHDWGENTKVYPRTVVHVGRNSKFVFNYINLRRQAHLQSIPLIIADDNSSVKSTSLLYVSGSDIDLGTELRLGNNASGQIVTRAVFEKGNLIVRGRIIGGHNSRGHNECDTMMLGDGNVRAVPELISLYKDAELSHEAAIGRIAETEVEYIMTRGLTREDAISLIVHGFLNPGELELSGSIKTEVERLLSKMGNNRF